ncbi:heme oxygenase-like protein [Xylariaceae sp. AK1471]|nr:heme oxygenase-like protein [Xylariaceae sp. AK1471]
MSSKTGDVARSLSDSINTATRSVHTELNKLVMSRLRLALPPQADDASQYVSGLLHIAPIYIVFESLWRAILELPEHQEKHGSEESDDACTTRDPAGLKPENLPISSKYVYLDIPQPVVSDRIKSLLAELHFEGLQRSNALREDLISLTNWSGRTLIERLNDASESPALSNFLTHTKNHVKKSPHILLAYAWVLYMALFSGGRFIRATLEGIYPAFWIPASAQQPNPAILAGRTRTNTQPLSFFLFDTPDNGEDLKLAFKKHLHESESVLTEAEREEIILEARCIFDFIIRLISELDDICRTDKEAAETRLLSLRSRDSVIVEKERRQQHAEMAQKAAKEADAERSSREGGEGHVRFEG